MRIITLSCATWCWKKPLISKKITEAQIMTVEYLYKLMQHLRPDSCLPHCHAVLAFTALCRSRLWPQTVPLPSSDQGPISELLCAGYLSVLGAFPTCPWTRCPFCHHPSAKKHRQCYNMKSGREKFHHILFSCLPVYTPKTHLHIFSPFYCHFANGIFINLTYITLHMVLM